MKQKLYKLILKIWDKEQLPTHFREGTVRPMHKKGERLKCNNQRPITLLYIAYKISAVLLNKRLSDIVGKKLKECPMGFPPNRPSIESIFKIRYSDMNIKEICIIHSSTIHRLLTLHTE